MRLGLGLGRLIRLRRRGGGRRLSLLRRYGGRHIRSRGAGFRRNSLSIAGHGRSRRRRRGRQRRGRRRRRPIVAGDAAVRWSRILRRGLIGVTDSVERSETNQNCSVEPPPPCCPYGLPWLSSQTCSRTECSPYHWRAPQARRRSIVIGRIGRRIVRRGGDGVGPSAPAGIGRHGLGRRFHRHVGRVLRRGRAGEHVKARATHQTERQPRRRRSAWPAAAFFFFLEMMEAGQAAIVVEDVLLAEAFCGQPAWKR